MGKRGKRQHRATKRRVALRDAAQTVAVTSPPAVPETLDTAERAPEPGAAQPSERRRRSVSLPIIGAAVAAILGIAILAAMVLREPADPAADTATPTVVVGVPDGEVVSKATPTPTARPTVAPTAIPTPTPTPAPIATPPPTAIATPAPQPTSAPPAQTPVPAATPAPTAIVVAVAGPEDAVASFYENAAAGDFDAAYSLWSADMRATYPREENLDGRFAETRSITFQRLFVAEQSDGAATVQADFTEFYEGGGSRQFVGYWRLILVDGRWLLDEPHY